MSREGRLVFLAGLTLTLYAATIFIKEGSIVFPFPLNDFIFFIVTAQFIFWHYKKGFPIYLFMIAALFGVLSNQVFWEMVMSLEDLGDFLKYPWILWFKLFQGIALVGSAIYLISKQRNHYTSLLTTAGIISYGIGFHTQIELFIFIGFGLIAASVLIKPTYKPFHFLWLLLFCLETTRFLTFFLA